jgi:hypothetical protein
VAKSPARLKPMASAIWWTGRSVVAANPRAMGHAGPSDGGGLGLS